MPVAGGRGGLEAEEEEEDPFTLLPPAPAVGDAAGHEGDAEDAFAFTVDGFGVSAAAPAAVRGDEVLFDVRQRKDNLGRSLEVLRGADGEEEIPLQTCSTTTRTHASREVLLRSPWLRRCLATPSGLLHWRSLEGEEEIDDEEVFSFNDEPLADGGGGSSPSGGRPTLAAAGTAVSCRWGSPEALELGLPARGTGRALVPADALRCLRLAGPSPAVFDVATLPAAALLSHFLWATVLELAALAVSCVEALGATVDVTTVALALAAGHVAGDDELLRRCYWCLRTCLCGATGVPTAWLDGRGPIKLANGRLSYGEVCSTPLAVLSRVIEQDVLGKRARWLIPCDCYTLCQVHRIRGEHGAYPHIFELRLDHSDEVIMRAAREEEQEACRIFTKDSDPMAASEHCEDYLGCASPNFWGTVFTVFDSGTDVDAFARRAKPAASLPVRPASALSTIGYETNLLGDCPRKISVDFEHGGEKYHMENMKPRWDKKLNSYALPFFGRVKKASAKNFQLVVNNDANTIFLMFGKISKDVFCLDFRAPLSHLNAMGIALAALAKKRAVS